jgi:hypothetical protein
MIILLAIMSGIILYMLLNQRGFQRVDHAQLNRADEQREHLEHRLQRMEQAMRQATGSSSEDARNLATRLREHEIRSQQNLERTSSLMQSQLATLSQRLLELDNPQVADKTRLLAEGLVETRARLQELELELAAEQELKHRLALRVDDLEALLANALPQAAVPASQPQAAAVAAGAGRTLSAQASQFFLSNEKYEQIAEMMIRNADFADICRDLRVSRSEIELVEAMAFRRSA